MTKTKMLLILSFAVTFAAGAAVGILASRPGHPPRKPSWLTAELNLTDQQRDQMRDIWSEVMRTGGRNEREQRKALSQQRDQAIAALLTDAQQPQYESILQNHTRKVEELAQERKRTFEQAVERTKQILTPEQATKYDELMKSRHDRGPGDRPGPPWGGPPPPHTGPPGPPPDNRPTPRGGGDLHE